LWSPGSVTRHLPGWNGPHGIDERFRSGLVALHGWGRLFRRRADSFELISYHFAANGILSKEWIPVFLAIATGFGVIANLALGKLYDQVGLIGLQPASSLVDTIGEYGMLQE
jgi:hypothetical protein